MKLILQAIKALFRKLENNIQVLISHIDKQNNDLTIKVSRVQKTAENAYDISYEARNMADSAWSEAISGIRCYDVVATAYPSKTSQLDVGEETRLGEYSAAFAHAINTFKFGDIVRTDYCYYTKNGTRYATNVMLTHMGYALKGGDWAIVDGVSQYYEVQIGADSLNSYIRRFV